MNNDLISREWLRTAITKMFGDSDIASSIDAIIDNAPTIELEKTSFIEGYKAGCEFGKECYSRPKGEWITHQTGMMLWEECNQCHAQVGTVGMNFCPNCGADMKGGAENETDN